MEVCNSNRPTRVTPSSTETTPLIAEEAPFHVEALEIIKIWSWVATGLENENYSAGEGQRQFNQPTSQIVSMQI
jgi:hypothetical protein